MAVRLGISLTSFKSLEILIGAVNHVTVFG